MTSASYTTQQPPRGHARLLLPADDNTTSTDLHTRVANVPKPLIICFHGSGETCSPTWDALATALVTTLRCRVLLYDRRPGSLRPAEVAAEMWDYVTATTATAIIANKSGSVKCEENEGLVHNIGAGDIRTKHGLHGPYLLIAHSYGGAFARAFVQHEYEQGQEHLIRPWKEMEKKRKQKRKRKKKSGYRVLGLVLVETGQEGGLDPAVDERQIRETIMRTRPVCVIKGNSLLQKWSELEGKERDLDAKMNVEIDGDMYREGNARARRRRRRAAQAQTARALEDDSFRALAGLWTRCCFAAAWRRGRCCAVGAGTC
ncbi:hypothetical protein GGR55DRAFT_647359 [Xylaria sp. FL0064]|nr:hypothetical protein GGR55DRAFT_647359 [Xylaria sp. FL0064]